MGHGTPNCEYYWDVGWEVARLAYGVKIGHLTAQILRWSLEINIVLSVPLLRTGYNKYNWHINLPNVFIFTIKCTHLYQRCTSSGKITMKLIFSTQNINHFLALDDFTQASLLKQLQLSNATMGTKIQRKKTKNTHIILLNSNIFNVIIPNALWCSLPIVYPTFTLEFDSGESTRNTIKHPTLRPKPKTLAMTLNLGPPTSDKKGA